MLQFHYDFLYSYPIMEVFMAYIAIVVAVILVAVFYISAPRKPELARLPVKTTPGRSRKI